MSKKNTDPLSAGNITFFAACRENTGKHMLDSGDAYGRIYDRPQDPKDALIIKEWSKGCSATICTAAFLDKFYTIDRKLQRKWEAWDKKQEGLAWFESGAKFAENVLGLFQEARDNMCNQETDFDQVFVYEVYNLEKASDWIYPKDDTLVVLYMHTGCDVRGGYGRPIFCRVASCCDQDTVPVNCCAGYYASDEDGNAIDEEGHWAPGWSSYPYGILEEEVAEWHDDTRANDSVEVTLNDGRRVKVYASVDIE